jgi:choice-of-anchor A domain-containing protein
VSLSRQATPNGVTPHEVTLPNQSGPLAAATDFNVFVLEDAVFSTGFVGGRVAIGDDATIEGATIGTFEASGAGADHLPESNGGRDTLVVGGHLEFRFGRVGKGNVTCGDCSPADIGQVFEPGSGNTWYETPPTGIDFAQAAVAFTALSDRIGQLPANGTVQIGQDLVTFTGTDNDLNVFSVSAADLVQSTTSPRVVFEVPTGASVIVNVTGPVVEWHARDI